MNDWWGEARSAAAREYGARHYRRFAAVHTIRRLGPLIGGLILTGGLAALVWLAVATWPNWKPALGYAIPAFIGLAVLAIVSAAARWWWNRRGW